jgi:hypothetical protein
VLDGPELAEVPAGKTDREQKLVDLRGFCRTQGLISTLNNRKLLRILL